MATAIKPMDVDGREEAEEQLYLKGPLSVLTSSVKTNSMVRHQSLYGLFCSWNAFHPGGFAFIHEYLMMHHATGVPRRVLTALRVRCT